MKQQQDPRSTLAAYMTTKRLLIVKETFKVYKVLV
jgi:hypothetical protein